MNLFLQPLRDLPPRARRWSLVLVLLFGGNSRDAGGRTGSFISGEHWTVSPRTGIVEGTGEWVSPLVQEQVWPNARRATNLARPVHVTWVDTNPLLLRLPLSGKWIT